MHEQDSRFHFRWEQQLKRQTGGPGSPPAVSPAPRHVARCRSSLNPLSHADAHTKKKCCKTSPKEGRQ